MDKDVIIIGGGMAGISAGKWCAELGLSALVLERGGELGGQLLWVFNPIHNYPGVDVKNGAELRDLILEQLRDPKPEIKTGAQVKSVNIKDKTVELMNGAKLPARALIIATGVRRRKLHVPGEEEFAGKGVLVSGAKDKESARGKNVVIVGGGDAAFENALILAEVARAVTLIHRNDKFRARGEFTEKAEKDPRIKIITNSIVEELEGGENVEVVKIRNTLSKAELALPAEAVLIRIGVEPNTELFNGQLELDENGFIKVNERCETSVAGVYAVGDVANPDSMTVSTAAGTGAIAAHMIQKKLAG